MNRVDLPGTNRQIVLARRPKAKPSLDDFAFVEGTVPEIADGQVLVRTLYVSVDPYMRGRMSDEKSYVAPFALNEPIAGGAIGEVIESRSSQFHEGDVVAGMFGWQQYAACDEGTIRTVNPKIAPVTTALGLLGMPGLTAYFGLLDIGRPKKGETVVVSGAAGAVGTVVVQIAKIHETRVVGIAGSDTKCAYLEEQLGIDETINYKETPDLESAIGASCPNGVDIYFDNVGGPISDAVINHLNRFARVPVCGAISSYNKGGDDLGPRVQIKLIKTSSLMQGFLVGNFADRFEEASLKLAKWYTDGRLTYEETILEGFDRIPEAFLGLFEGTNLGKLLVKVADPIEAKL